MKKGWFVAIVPGLLALFVVVLLVVLLLVKVLWAWTVPDLFPEAVKQNLVAADISLKAAFKIAFFVAVLAAIAGATRK